MTNASIDHVASDSWPKSPHDDELAHFLAVEESASWQRHVGQESALLLRERELREDTRRWLSRGGMACAFASGAVVFASFCRTAESTTEALQTGSWAAIQALLVVVLLMGGIGTAGKLAHLRAITRRRALLAVLQRGAAPPMTAHERCPRCRYDLRGTAVLRCSECGALLIGDCASAQAMRDRRREDRALARRSHLRRWRRAVVVIETLLVIQVFVAAAYALLMNLGGTDEALSRAVAFLVASVVLAALVGQLVHHATWRERYARTLQRLRETERLLLDRIARE